MKVVIQIVNSASVKVEGQLINKIDKGYLLFVGIDKSDDELIVKKMAKKIIEMRINKDLKGKTNLSILDVNGEILSISQFTLCAILDSRRPSFSNAARADVANKLYEIFNEELTKYNVNVKKGVFGADMKVNLENDGPFTIVVTDKDL